MAKDRFTLSLQQSVMLETAFDRNGWSPADVLLLCSGDILAQILPGLPEGRLDYPLKPAGMNLEMDRFSVRVARILKSQQVLTLQSLTEKTKWQLLKFPSFGEHSLREVEVFLKERGLALAETPKKKET